ncbi:CPBP family intramembrane glutamic endopeptidase [Paenibacillus sp. DCT19]|nr:CPBP family intramembrane glutamic endopeptidase [Paenibacillus sp. DCT19]
MNFIRGIVLAWTYERTGSVVPGMIVHGVFNTTAVLLTR